ncbi:MAG: sigma-70 family RNA polymerase sigma factor [Syntrophomonadaceae bacterium]|jgi:RNA polymerase sigma-70 factor (ECF subfamily)|nr:sigma-70 family RNA polymerase sigma factor [Syntrophomonadaceae bacterium]
MDTRDDRQLVLACRKGDEYAYRVLLSRYESYIYSLCFRLTGRREDALELAQEAMVKIVMGLDSYQINQPFKPWLRRLVINTGINFLRRRSPDLLSLDQDIADGLTLGDSLAAGNSGNPQMRLEWMETRQALEKAMEELPPEYRLVLTLRHQEGMSYKEIADSIGIPVGTVKTYLFRARNRLRQMLKDVYGWED